MAQLGIPGPDGHDERGADAAPDCRLPRARGRRSPLPLRGPGSTWTREHPHPRVGERPERVGPLTHGGRVSDPCSLGNSLIALTPNADRKDTGLKTREANACLETTSRDRK